MPFAPEYWILAPILSLFVRGGAAPSDQPRCGLAIANVARSGVERRLAPPPRAVRFELRGDTGQRITSTAEHRDQRTTSAAVGAPVEQRDRRLAGDVEGDREAQRFAGALPGDSGAPGGRCSPRRRQAGERQGEGGIVSSARRRRRDGSRSRVQRVEVGDGGDRLAELGDRLSSPCRWRRPAPEHATEHVDQWAWLAARRDRVRAESFWSAMAGGYDSSTWWPSVTRRAPRSGPPPRLQGGPDVGDLAEHADAGLPGETPTSWTCRRARARRVADRPASCLDGVGSAAVSRTLRVTANSNAGRPIPRRCPAEECGRASAGPMMPHWLAGLRIEPPPSLACAVGTMPDATAAAALR
jgi:hypothetical protein